MKKLKTLIKVLVPVLAFGFLGSELVTTSSKIESHTLTFEPNSLVASLILLLAIFLADGYGWILILRNLNQRILTGQGLYIWFYSSFCRYIPGVVWPYLTRIELCRTAGINKSATASSMIIENILLAGTSLMLSAPLVAFYFDIGIEETAYASLLIIIMLTSVIFVGRTSFAMIFVEKYLSPLKALTIPKIVRLSIYYLIFWITFSIAFSLFCASVLELEMHNLILVALAFPVSFAIGFIASISPGGLGIREGVLYTLLSMQIDSTSAALIAITSRIWLISIELAIAATIAGLYLGRPKTFT